MNKNVGSKKWEEDIKMLLLLESAQFDSDRIHSIVLADRLHLLDSIEQLEGCTKEQVKSIIKENIVGEVLREHSNTNTKRLSKKELKRIKGVTSQRQKKRSLINQIKFAVLERDKFRCVQCDSTDQLSIDHIIPLRSLKLRRTQVIAWKIDNCQTLCLPCHQKKNHQEQHQQGLVKNCQVC